MSRYAGAFVLNFFRLLVLIGIVGVGYAYWRQHGAHSESATAVANGQAGFVPLPPIDGQQPRVVYVVAAQNCPHEEAQRADRLAVALGRAGIPVERTSALNFSFSGQPDTAVVDRINRVMNGPLPVVFIDGRAKNNPSLEEVLEGFRSKSE